MYYFRKISLILIIFISAITLFLMSYSLMDHAITGFLSQSSSGEYGSGTYGSGVYSANISTSTSIPQNVTYVNATGQNVVTYVNATQLENLSQSGENYILLYNEAANVSYVLINSSQNITSALLVINFNEGGGGSSYITLQNGVASLTRYNTTSNSTYVIPLIVEFHKGINKEKASSNILPNLKSLTSRINKAVSTIVTLAFIIIMIISFILYRMIKKPVLSDEVKDYIIHARKIGQGDEQIEQSFRANGWSEEHIKSIRQFIKKHNQ